MYKEELIDNRNGNYLGILSIPSDYYREDMLIENIEELKEALVFETDRELNMEDLRQVIFLMEELMEEISEKYQEEISE